MAQLKDSVVTGNLRVTDQMYANTVQAGVIKVPTSSGGSTYGTGSNGQVIKSNGSSAYWAADNATDNTKVAKTGDNITGSLYNTANFTVKGDGKFVVASADLSKVGAIVGGGLDSSSKQFAYVELEYDGDTKLKLYSSNEGGNIEIKSPSGKTFETDAYDNTNLRTYSFDDNGNYHDKYFDRGAGIFAASDFYSSSTNTYFSLCQRHVRTMSIGVEASNLKSGVFAACAQILQNISENGIYVAEIGIAGIATLDGFLCKRGNELTGIVTQDAAPFAFAYKPDYGIQYLSRIQFTSE